jgi:phage-related protein
VKPSISKGKITVNSDDELFQIKVENRGSIIVLSMAHAD